MPISNGILPCSSMFSYGIATEMSTTLELAAWSRPMNPKQLAKQECTNYGSDSICDGIQILDDLRQVLDRALVGKPCCVNKERCSYFEAIVLPSVERAPDKHPGIWQMRKAAWTYRNRVAAKAIPDAESRAGREDKTKQPVPRFLRKCKSCGKELPGAKPNRKFCHDCAEARHREAKKLSATRSRRRQSVPVSA